MGAHVALCAFFAMQSGLYADFSPTPLPDEFGMEPAAFLAADVRLS